jgi:hypothetical protein
MTTGAGASVVENLAEVTLDETHSGSVCRLIDEPSCGSSDRQDQPLEESLIGMQSERRKSGRFLVEGVSEKEEGTPQRRKVCEAKTQIINVPFSHAPCLLKAVLRGSGAASF